MSVHEIDNQRPTAGSDQIRDLGSQFRKVLVSYAQLDETHEHRQQLEQELYAKLGKFCGAHGFFHMGVSAFSLHWEQQPIYTSQSGDDAIAHVFYNDGVEQISFEEGLELSELKTFCQLWAHALSLREMPVQDLVSRVWEADLNHIWLRTKDSFSLILESHEDMKGALLSYQERMRTWVDTQGKWTSSRNEVTQDYFVVEVEDACAQIDVFKMDTLSALSEADLKQDVDKNRLRMFLSNDDSAEEKKRFVERENSTFNNNQSRTVQQMTRLFWSTSRDATTKERSMLLEAVWRSFDQLIQLGALEEMNTVLTFMDEEQSVDESLQFFFSQLVRHFEQPRILDQLIPYLGKPKDGDLAVELLSYIRDSEHSKLFPYYQKLVTPSGIKRLSSVIAKMRPSGETIINYLGTQNEMLIEELLELANHCSRDDARAVRDKVLSMEKSKLWLLVLKHMPRMELLERKKELLERVPLAGKDYEKFLFNVLVNEKDPNIVPYVFKKINTAALAMDERKRWVHALAAIRDEKSTLKLREILASSSRPVELRMTAALSLGKLKDQESVSLLNEIRNKKFFGNKALKEACQEALHRMSKSQGGKN